ncbi:hypothetical protein LIER_35647 [Lithospermum erythrorhizon]|uniref:Pre-mRNA polyadenylation factor Fip1 domain-containing protein n=1 Tax=Lithospermum erythrorhizon TaxID=34254 RepID=A0AAV3NUR1_LITER
MEDLDDDFGDLYADVAVQASSAMQTEVENGFSQLPLFKKVEILENNGIGNCSYNEFYMEPKSGILGNNGVGNCGYNEFSNEPKSGILENNGIENCGYNEFSMEPKSGILGNSGIKNCGYNEFSMEPKCGILGNNGNSALSKVDELAEEEEEEEEEEGDDEEDVVKKVYELAEEGEVEGEGEEEEVVEKGEEEGDDEDTRSDSEDELNIVLNDDDDYVLGKNLAANDNVNKNEFIMNDHVSKRGWFDYKVNEEVDLCKDAAGQNFSGGRIGSGYNSQYKNMRFQPPAFPSESRANGSLSLSSYSFKSVQDELKDDGYAHNLNTSSSASRRGDNFSLPLSRTILDVDIDSLNDKPWRHPGADLTDFFNFGFNENSWKQYCDRLNMSRDQISGSRYSCKPFRHNKVELNVGTEHEDKSQKVELERLANSVQLESGVISGRAIQVEECVTERQPSINRWGPLDRDSDVVIQITVQDDLKEDCLNSAKEDVDQTEVEYEDTILDESRELLCFSSATEDELSSVEGDDERSGNSVLESGKSCKHSPTSGSVSKHLEIDHESGQIVDADDVVFGGKWTDAVPIDEEMNTSIESRRSDERRLSDAAPSVLKPHLNHGDQSPYSVTPPNSPGHRDYGYDTYAGYRKSSNKSKLNSPNSLPEVRDSVLYGCYLSEDSKKYGGRSKPRDREFYSSGRTVLQPDLSYHGNKGIHLDGDGSNFSAKERFSDSRHSTIYQKHNGLDSYDSKKNSYCKTSNSFPDYGDRDHKVPTYDVRDRYMRRPNSKGTKSEYDLGLNNRGIMNGKKRHFEPKPMLDHKEGRKGLFFDEKRRHDQQYMESQPHCGIRHWHSKSGSYIDNEGGNQWRSGKHDLQFSKEVEVDDLLEQCNYESRLTQGDHRYSKSSSVGVRDCVLHKGDKHLSYYRREVESTAWSSRRRDGAYNGLDEVQYGEYVDDKFTRLSSRDSQNLPHSTCRQRLQGGSSPRDCIDQSHSRNRRNVAFAERSCHNDRLGHYSSFDAEDNQDCYERKRDHAQYGESRWNDEHYKFEKDSEVLPGGPCYPYKRDPIHKNIDPQHGPNLSGNHINHMQAGRGRFKMTRGHNKRGQVFQNPRFIRNDNYENKLPRFRSSVDSQVVGVDRKSCMRNAKYML